VADDGDDEEAGGGRLARIDSPAEAGPRLRRLAGEADGRERVCVLVSGPAHGVVPVRTPLASVNTTHTTPRYRAGAYTQPSPASAGTCPPPASIGSSLVAAREHRRPPSRAPPRDRRASASRPRMAGRGARRRDHSSALAALAPPLAPLAPLAPAVLVPLLRRRVGIGQEGSRGGGLATRAEPGKCRPSVCGKSRPAQRSHALAPPAAALAEPLAAESVPSAGSAGRRAGAGVRRRRRGGAVARPRSPQSPRCRDDERSVALEGSTAARARPDSLLPGMLVVA